MNSVKPFRFVWRNATSSRWFTTCVDAASPVEAVNQLQTHLTKKLKKSLAAVVVDHPFYNGEPHNPDNELQVLVSENHTLLDTPNPFHYEFDNRVWAPGARPDRAKAQ